MWESFKEYLQDIKPTRKGGIAILLVLVLLPAITDLFFMYYAIGARHRESFFMTPFMVMQSVGFIPVLCIYLAAFFIISFIVKQILDKRK